MDVDADAYLRFYFVGYLTSGAYFAVLAIWWAANVFKSFYDSQCEMQCSSTNDPLTFTKPFFSKICFEGYLQVIGSATIMGILLQNAIRFGIWYHEDTPSHMLIGTAFLLSGLVDLLKAQKWQLPRGLKATFMAIGFATLAVITLSRQDGTLSTTSFRFHVYAAILCWLTVGVIYVEANHSHLHTYSLLRALLVLCLGTWHFQIGFDVFPPQNHYREVVADSRSGQLRHIVYAFIGHLQGNFLLILLIGVGIWFCGKFSNVRCAKYDLIVTDIKK